MDAPVEHRVGDQSPSSGILQPQLSEERLLAGLKEVWW